MSTRVITPEQRAYHLRKMRTRMARVDINHDGNISREDYALMGEKLTECGDITKARANSIREEFLRVADEIGLIPGVKIPLQEAAQKASDSLLAMTAEERAASVVASGMMYDMIDIDEDGYISIPEFKAFFKVLAPDLSEEQVTVCFDALDANKNGEINREEFLIGAEDFLHGLEESPFADAFYGPLID